MIDQDGRTLAPDCTDNFQIASFSYDGTEWQSVEQCYQAQKFLSATQRHTIQSAVPKRRHGKYDKLETAHQYGMRVWDLGQRRAAIRPDWDQVKMRIMYEICWAKYQSNPDLQQDILAMLEAP